jgi:hypothetical protein
MSRCMRYDNVCGLPVTKAASETSGRLRDYGFISGGDVVVLVVLVVLVVGQWHLGDVVEGNHRPRSV